MRPLRTLVRAILLAVLLPAVGLEHACAEQPYVHDRDIWYRPPGARRPLKITADKAPKSGPALSEDGRLVAYYTETRQGDGRQPSLVVVDLAGRKVMETVLADPDSREPIGSILRIEWIDRVRIGVECHINPSVNRYLIVEPPDRTVTEAFWGYGFRWSPDRTKLAHVGHIVHFAPDAEHSEYLQINQRTVYPRQGKVLRSRRPGRTDMHRFVTPFAWSPDSWLVAFVDRVEPAGEEFLVVACEDEHRLWLRRLPAEVNGQKKLAWLDYGTVRLTRGRRSWVFDAATSALIEDTVR